MSNNKIALVGHSGFLGRAVCDVLHVDYTFNRDNIDLYDANLREHFPKDIGTLVFLAADPRLYYYQDKPGPCLRSNFELVKAIAEIDFEQFVFVSSIAVYKDTAKFSTDKTTGWNEKMHFYGLAKLLAEQCVQICQERFCILRMSTFYSEGMTKGPMLDIVQNSRTFVDLDSCYSFLHITDAAEAVRHSVSERLHGIFDVTDSQSYSLRDLFPAVEEIEVVSNTYYQYDSDNRAFVATGWEPRRKVVEFVSEL